MAKVTQKQIFEAAHEVLTENGFEKARLATVARKLEITPTALYKHFSNKEDLFTSMNQAWLEEVDQPVLEQVNRVLEEDRVTSLHDWLWLLVTRRRDAYQSDQEMMHYYEDQLAQASDLINPRVESFANAVETIMAWDTFRHQRGLTIMQALTYFYHPFFAFADKWDDNLLQALFESTWLELLPIVTQDLAPVEKN